MSFLKHQRLRAVCTAAAGVALLAGCDVTNPGPVQDAFLAEPESHEALVLGSGRTLAEGVNNLAYTGALISREIYPGGQTGSLGHSVLEQSGFIEPGSDVGQSSGYNNLVQARFIGEAALDIFAEAEAPVDGDLEALAHIYAGYAYRVIADNWCETVFSTEEQLGSLEPSTQRLPDAEQHFTDAIALTSDPDLVRAAYAGRAQVRAWMGDWAGVRSDAGEITDNSWSFDLNMDEIDNDTRNQIWFSNDNSPYRGYTMLFTFFGGNDGVIATNNQGENLPQFPGYSFEVDDPRIPVTTTDEEFANAALQSFGQVPFINQQKYTGPNDDYRLASGAEMRLLEAEADLNDGEWEDAMDKIDDLRAFYGLDNLMTDFPEANLPAASDVPTAMSYLMRERSIELWGEARRWGDLRRWLNEGQGLGGDVRLADFEATASLFRQHERSICADVPDDERDSNPNVPSAAGS